MRRLGHLSRPRETRLQRANQNRPVGYRTEWRGGVPPSGPTKSRRCATSRSLKPRPWPVARCRPHKARATLNAKHHEPGGHSLRQHSPGNAGCELAPEVPRSVGELRLRVTESSMLPAVWPGDAVTACRRSAAQVLPGDIILCARQGRPFAHQVVERTTQLFTQAA
jgi:hypothetical protein